jgi:hypothetical protein
MIFHAHVMGPGTITFFNRPSADTEFDMPGPRKQASHHRRPQIKYSQGAHCHSFNMLQRVFASLEHHVRLCLDAG